MNSPDPEDDALSAEGSAALAVAGALFAEDAVAAKRGAAESDSARERFLSASTAVRARPCDALLAAQRIALDTGPQRRRWPHRHGTDGFFAAAFERS